MRGSGAIGSRLGRHPGAAGRAREPQSRLYRAARLCAAVLVLDAAAATAVEQRAARAASRTFAAVCRGGVIPQPPLFPPRRPPPPPPRNHAPRTQQQQAGDRADGRSPQPGQPASRRGEGAVWQQGGECNVMGLALGGTRGGAHARAPVQGRKARQPGRPCGGQQAQRWQTGPLDPQVHWGGRGRGIQGVGVPARAAAAAAPLSACAALARRRRAVHATRSDAAPWRPLTTPPRAAAATLLTWAS